MRQNYESWVHGSSVLLERVGSPGAIDKASALSCYGGHYGDLLGTGDMGGAACFRIGWAARFVMLDLGNGNAPKSGSFWVHYAVPTFPIHSDTRSKAKRVFINYEVPRPSTISELSIGSVHVWDGNRNILRADGVPRSADGFNGGISGTGTSAETGKKDRLLTVNVNQDVFFGVGVSLHIEANTAKDGFLEIRGVGVEFESEDRT